MYGRFKEMYGNLHFSGALRVAFFEKDEEVEKFLGTHGLGDALSAMHDFYDVDFVLRRCEYRFVNGAGYEFYGFFPRSPDFCARIQRLGVSEAETLYWDDVNPNYFAENVIETLHGGFKLFSVVGDANDSFFRVGFVFEGSVPSFSCRRELEMKFSLMGGRNGQN